MPSSCFYFIGIHAVVYKMESEFKKDNNVSMHFEHTVGVKNGKAELLSSFEPIEMAELKNSNLYTRREKVVQ